MIWNGIPSIRKELAEALIKEFGLSQRDAAEKLGLTPSAVCQYLSKKRGKTDLLPTGRSRKTRTNPISSLPVPLKKKRKN